MAVNAAPDSAPKIAGHVVFQRVSDGAILLSTAEEVYYGLNEVGAQVWERLSDEEGLEEIIEALRERYPDVDAERIRSDVEEVVEELTREGLVEWADSCGEDGEPAN